AVPRPLHPGLRHGHQPDQRPGLRAAADRDQDDPLQRPAGGQAVGHAVQEHVRGREVPGLPAPGVPDRAARRMKAAATLAAGLAALLLPAAAGAAEIDGAALSPLWAVPFAGILLSIALLPMLAPGFWHHHFGKVAAAWSLAFLLPFAAAFGPAATGSQFVHALVGEYIPFILLLTALFTVAGGIHIRGNLHGS